MKKSDRQIIAALLNTKGNVKDAAILLKMEEATLRQYVQDSTFRKHYAKGLI